MSLIDIFWIYFILTSLQPWISQRMLEWKLVLNPWECAPITESITLKVFGEWAERQRAELFQSKRILAELETQGCCNPGLEFANTFGVI